MTRAKVNLSFPTIRQISPKEWKYINDHVIKVWHFEWRGKGVVPVEGKYDPNNPDHVHVRKAVKERHSQ